MPKSLRVLIVEDHPEDAELMARRLEQQGYKLNWQRVETEPAYLEALKTKPDLILADWSLPEFSGLRAIQLLKECELDIPIILVSGSIGEELAVTALQQGAYDYVLKDRTARLGQAVSHALEQKKLRQKRRMAEAALRESEELYRQLFDAESDAIILIDNEDGHILEANDAAAALYGYSRDDLLSKKNTDLSAEPDETRRVTLTTPLDAERVVKIPLRLHRRKDGTVFPVEITGRFFTRQNRAVHLAAIRDITERMKAEVALRESSRLNQTLLDGFPCVALLLRPGTREIVATNRAGIEAAAVPGARCYATWGQREEPCPWCLAPEVWALGEARHLEVEARGVVWDAHWIPVSEDLYMHYAFDITPRKRTEEALRQSEGHFRSLFENMLNGYAYCQMQFERGRPIDFTYLDVNTAFDTLTGLKDVVGKKVSEVIPGLQESNPEVFEIYGRVALTGHPEQFETYIAALDMWFSVSVYSPKKEHFVAVFEVITERKRAEEALRASEARFSTVFRSSPIGISITRFSDGRLVDANDAFLKMTGYAREEAIGHTVLELKMWADPEERRRIARVLIEQGRVNNVELQFRKKSGEIGESLASAELIDLGGERYMLSLVNDVSDRKKAEEALKKSEEQYRMLADNATDVVWTSDLKTGKFSYFSPSVQNLRGYTPAEAAALPLEKTLTPDSIERARVFYEEALNWEKTPGRDPDRASLLELGEFRKDGSIVATETRMKFLRDAQGSPIGLLGITRDISERKLADEALREREVRLRLATDAAGMGTWDLDLVTGKTVWSQNVFDLLGYDPAGTEASSEALFSRMHPDDVEQVLQARETAQREHALYAADYRIFRADNGQVRWVSSASRFIYDDRGEAIRLNGVIFDISERKKAGERIHHLNQVLRAIRDVNRLIGRVEDPRQLIREVCQVLVETRGYQSAWIALTDAAGRPATCAEAGIGEAFKPLAESLERGVLPLCCEDARSKAGVYLVTDREQICRSCPISPANQATNTMCLQLNHQGITFGYLTVAVDRTLGVDTEEQGLFADMGGDLAFALYNLEMRKAKEVAEEAQQKLGDQLIQAQKMEAVGRLAGGVAHDFNNMLSVILGYSETILSDLNPKDPIYKDLNEIKAAAERSASLTRQLLAFSRRQTIAPKVIDLKEQMKGMEFLLRRIIGEDIDLEFDFPESLWSVKMDPSQLDQIVANLAVNARDAMPDGGKMTVEMGNIALDEAYCQDHLGFSPGEYVLLALSDTGCGMDKETLAHVFEPFFTTKGEGKGTGLGLATVYGIVKQNNGFVNFYSEPGQGTTAKIYLPRHVGEEKAESAPSLKTGVTGGQETILLVEDEGQVRRLAKTILERSGYQVLEAAEPGEALVLCERHPGDIHLLLTDVVMPNMNGKDLAERIRVLKPEIRCLFMSGYTANAIAHRGVLEKGIHFIQKPFSLTTLAKKVREVLDED